MLNNFIYAKSKAMFEERIAEVPNEAIVFIEDTKEIWNHGHYFAGEGVDPVAFDNLQTEVSQMKADKQDPLISGTWSELKEMRDNATLKPGQQYRITDYVTTTSQAGTQSAGHQFDVIVTADSENTLNEEARACIHEGDTYFSDAGAKLEAWKIWYCLDNDAERFAWADAENGKGVIYRMIDEHNNDCPYDFKNIIYVFNKSFMYNQWGKDSQFMRDASLDKVIEDIQYYGYTTYNKPNGWVEGKCWVTDENVTPETQLYNTDGSSISYGGSIFNIIDEYLELYTFNEGVLNDFSLEGEYCYDNTILVWVGGLNRIVFKNDKTYEYQGQLFNRCHSNTFGRDCFATSFGTGCYSNSFGNDCPSNIFGINCFANSFGDACDSNSFGNYCNSNSFGNYSGKNSFGGYCCSNSFGNSCNSNSFGDSCSANSFGNDCLQNSFGSYCNFNRFDSGCNSNSFGNDCHNNSFSNNCYYNSFRSSASKTASLKGHCSYNHFDDGCSYNVIWNSSTTSTSVSLKNININRGVSGTATNYNFINIDTLNAGYEIQVAKNSKGEIKIYCEADLIA